MSQKCETISDVDDDFTFEFVALNSLGSGEHAKIQGLASKVLSHFQSQAVADDNKDLYSGAAYSSLTDEEVSQVLDQYDIGTLKSIKNLAGGLSNSSYKLDTSEGTYLLKIWDEKSVEELHVQFDVLRVLKKHNFPTCYAVPTKTGSDLLLFNSHRITILDFFHGSIPKRSPKVVTQLGKALAQLHQASPIPDTLHGFPMGLDQMEPFLETEVVGHPAQNDEFVKFLQESIKRLKPVVNDKSLDESILHGDLFLENTMFQDEELVGVIDFEEVCRGPAILDVAMAILGCCYKPDDLVDFDAARAFLTAYHKLRPLSELEFKAFPAFLEYSCLSIGFWRFRQFNVRKPDEDRKSSHECMVRRCKGVSEQMEAWRKVFDAL